MSPGVMRRQPNTAIQAAGQLALPFAPFEIREAPTGGEGEFSGLESGDEIRVLHQELGEIEGSYMPVAGMHFIKVPDPTTLLRVRAEGPLDPALTLRIDRLRRWPDIKAERHAALRGEPLPGRKPSTAMEFEYRLAQLAKAIAGEEHPHRKDQLRRQFHDVADQVSLAKGKRAWVLAEGVWYLTHNQPPQMIDLWIDDVASPSFFARPRPQDFDPDPVARRRRAPWPAAVREDPRSVPNMLAALRRAGLKAVITRAGDPVEDRAILQVDLLAGRKGRFYLRAARAEDGELAWRMTWGGNDNKSGRKAHRRACRLPDYLTLTRVFRCGLVVSCRPTHPLELVDAQGLRP